MSAQSDENSEQKQLAELASQSTWQKLIHLEETDGGTFTTDIVTSGFYLSQGEFVDPFVELVHTLNAFASQPQAGITHSQCLFPARLFWLQSKAPELLSNLPQVDCPDLLEWKTKTDGRSFHLIHVSGCLLYTSPSPRDQRGSRMPSSA